MKGRGSRRRGAARGSRGRGAFHERGDGARWASRALAVACLASASWAWANVPEAVTAAEPSGDGLEASSPLAGYPQPKPPPEVVPSDKSAARFIPPLPAEVAQGAGLIKSTHWAVVLGKALFWDQQVGSDGQACAS